MRYQFFITAGAQEDMRQCAKADRRAAADIAVFLREVEADIVWCEALIDTSVYHEDGIQSDELFAFMQDQRINAYLVRLVNVGVWRIISAVDHRGKRVGIFGVMHRKQEYQKDVKYCQRIADEYDGHNFPRY